MLFRQPQLRHILPRQGGKRLQQCLLHPHRLRAAAVKKLQPGAGDQRAVVGIQLGHMQLLYAGFITQATDPIRLRAAHLLQQTQFGIIPLVIQHAPDRIHQVLFFPVHVSRQEPAAAGHRLADQLPQQGRHRLQDFFASRHKGIVNEAGHKAHTLALSLFADGIGDLRAIEPVQLRAEQLHVRKAHRSAAQNRRNQRVGRGVFPAQRCDKLGRQQPRFEFAGRQTG